MKPQEINIKIAEFCGVSFEKKDVCPICHGITPYVAGDDYGITIWKECDFCSNTGKVEHYYIGLPNYCNDLNAMHEAVSFLRNSNRLLYIKYTSMLNEIVARYNSDPVREPYRSTATCDATAAQRAEALYHIITCPQT